MGDGSEVYTGGNTTGFASPAGDYLKGRINLSAALDRISTADGSLAITDAAKALQIRPRLLFDHLSRNGWIYKRAGAAHWLGYQVHVVNGDLEHKVTTVDRPDGSQKISEQVRVTPKGLTKLAKSIPGASMQGGLQ